MSLASLFTGGVDKVVDGVMGGLDALFTSDEERLIAKKALEQVKTDAKLKQEELSLEFEREITKRWTSDNEHFVTRLVRPISYISVLGLFGVVVLADGNIGEFRINEAYIPVLETLMITMTLAYFGSRGAEKITKAYNEKK